MELVLCTALDLSPSDLAALAAESGFTDAGISVCQTRAQVEALLQTLKQQLSSPLFSFPVKGGAQMLDLDKVCCFRGEKHRITALLDDGTTLLSRSIRISTIEALKSALERIHFVQVSRACFVNPNYIARTAGHSLHLKNGVLVPITRNYRAAFQRQLHSDFSRQER